MLLRIDVPTFDSNIMNWVVFWEQFDAAIHSKCQLSNADKLMYLRHALKDSMARQVIEGLLQAGDNFPVAIDCHLRHYNWPRLIHRPHVRRTLPRRKLEAVKSCFVYVTPLTSIYSRVFARLLSNGAAPMGCLVHDLDTSGVQLCTTWVQSKVMDGYGQICYSCISKGWTTGTRRGCVLLCYL